MTLPEFNSLIQKQPDGIVLLEGRRTIPAEDYARASLFAKTLALRFPQLAGGTGHTLRVCQQEGVPVAFQDSWMEWN